MFINIFMDLCDIILITTIFSLDYALCTSVIKTRFLTWLNARVFCTVF